MATDLQSKPLQYGWRITKYNPKYRNKQGYYKREDWISVSDIGRTFNNIALTKEAYIQVEDAYVQAIEHFINEAGISELFLLSLEKYQGIAQNHISTLAPIDISEDMLVAGVTLGIDKVGKLSRLILRGIFWAKLELKDKFFIHFGYDYYMYIGSDVSSLLSIQSAQELGLFVENMNSPYLEKLTDD